MFTPEDFSDEQKQIGETTEQFVTNEIVPNMEEIEKQNFDLVVEGMKKCGELGLLMMDSPEEYGGLELDKASSMLVAVKRFPWADHFPWPIRPTPASERCRLSITEPPNRKKSTWKRSPPVSGVRPIA